MQQKEALHLENKTHEEAKRKFLTQLCYMSFTYGDWGRTGENSNAVVYLQNLCWSTCETLQENLEGEPQ